MKQLMTENQTAASHSFLLDDDSSIPFALDDIQTLLEDKDMYGPVELPQLLQEGRSFDFLRRWADSMRPRSVLVRRLLTHLYCMQGSAASWHAAHRGLSSLPCPAGGTACPPGAALCQTSLAPAFAP